MDQNDNINKTKQTKFNEGECSPTRILHLACGAKHVYQ